jgi:oxygen-independent coproporphyrinogen III oxidase
MRGHSVRSLYLHIPFCEKKCLYCDFYSIENRSQTDRFLDALVLELERAGRQHLRSGVDTVFFGGGTPSLLTPEELGRLLDTVRGSFRLAEDAEITVETNPGTVTLDTLRAYRARGVNRLSIGIQSFHPEELRFLDRIHDPEQAEACVRAAREAGFQNLSVDLIYALPGQGLSGWGETLRRAVALGPCHISAYSLIVEPNTPLFRLVKEGKVVPAAHDDEAVLYEFTMEYLAAAGYEQYEVSNFARPGFRCRHNENYWSHGAYLGFGPSAHSFLPADGGREGRRWWNVGNLVRYLERIEGGLPAAAGEERLAGNQLRNERVFLGLRGSGLPVSDIVDPAGMAVVRDLTAHGLATVHEGVLRLTPRGYLLCDEISAKLMV